eukprot:4641114-Pleurochrysis_carterae.AAC.2
MQGLTDRARTNQHRQERKKETHRDKRIRLAKGEKRKRHENSLGKTRTKAGGEWELLQRKKDTAARRLIGGQEGKGTYKVFKAETMELAHGEEYAGHPILRLFTIGEWTIHVYVKGRYRTHEGGGCKEADIPHLTSSNVTA